MDDGRSRYLIVGIDRSGLVGRPRKKRFHSMRHKILDEIGARIEFESRPGRTRFTTVLRVMER